MSNNQRLCHATLQIHKNSLRKNKSELPSQLTLGQQRRAPSLRIATRKRAQAAWMQSGSDDHLNLRCPTASLEETSQFRTRSIHRSLHGIFRGCWPSVRTAKPKSKPETKSCHHAIRSSPLCPLVLLVRPIITTKPFPSVPRTPFLCNPTLQRGM